MDKFVTPRLPHFGQRFTFDFTFPLDVTVVPGYVTFPVIYLRFPVPGAGLRGTGVDLVGWLIVGCSRTDVAVTLCCRVYVVPLLYVVTVATVGCLVYDFTRLPARYLYPFCYFYLQFRLDPHGYFPHWPDSGLDGCYGSTRPGWVTVSPTGLPPYTWIATPLVVTLFTVHLPD